VGSASLDIVFIIIPTGNEVNKMFCCGWIKKVEMGRMCSMQRSVKDSYRVRWKETA
jgi:hypothetical protein